MHALIEKYKKDILIALGLVFLYFGTHLPSLTRIPIFTDEAIYLRWSQIMAYDASLRYIPLVDGKPPLFMWATAILLRVFSNQDPLLLTRLVSVGAGFLSLIAIYFASYHLFHNKRLSLIASFFYVVIPFTFFYDRFGLADSLLTMFGIWSLGLGVILARYIRLDAALLLGWVIGLGLLTKTPAVFYLLFLPLYLVFFPWREKGRSGRLINWGFYFLLVVISSQLLFSILRLFPLFHMISQKNAEFVVPISEFLKHPFIFFPSNFLTLLRWQIDYLTYPLVVLVVVGIIVGLIKKSREILVLVMCYSMFFVAMAAFNKGIFARYLLIVTPGLIIIAAFGFSEILERLKVRALIQSLVLLIILVPALYTDFKLLSDPINAPIPDSDSRQYINGTFAGNGVIEVRKFLVNESKKYKKITVGTEGTFGLMPYSLQLYQKDYPNVDIKDFWPMPEKVPEVILEAAKDHPTYFIVYQRARPPLGWKVTLVSHYQQGKSQDYLQLYKVLPP